MMTCKILKTACKTINLLTGEFGRLLISKSIVSSHEYSYDTDLVFKIDKILDTDFLERLNKSSVTNIYNNYTTIVASNFFVNQVISKNTSDWSSSSIIAGNEFKNHLERNSLILKKNDT